jgi:hypothetical protein
MLINGNPNHMRGKYVDGIASKRVLKKDYIQNFIRYISSLMIKKTNIPGRILIEDDARNGKIHCLLHTLFV